MKHSKPSIKISSFTKTLRPEAKIVRSEVTKAARNESGGFGLRAETIMGELADVPRKILFDHLRTYCEKIGTTLEDAAGSIGIEITSNDGGDGVNLLGTDVIALCNLIDPPYGDNFFSDLNQYLLGEGAMQPVEECMKSLLPLLNEIAVSKFETENDREPFEAVVALLRFEKIQEGKIVPLLLFSAGGLTGEMGERVKTDKPLMISILSETANLVTKQVNQNGAHLEAPFYIEVNLGQTKDRGARRAKNMEDDRMLVTGTFLEI
jgi:hypothetical protein